jgi:hypothetical protein
VIFSYNPRTDEWEPLPSMKYARNFFGVAPFDSGRSLYAIGGADLIEIFNPRSSTWTVSTIQMNRKRNRHAVVWCDWTWDSPETCDIPEKDSSSNLLETSTESGGDFSKTEDRVSDSDTSDVSIQF